MGSEPLSEEELASIPRLYEAALQAREGDLGRELVALGELRRQVPRLLATLDQRTRERDEARAKVRRVKDLETRFRVLHDAATGREKHWYDGLCPDTVEGPDTRDPECPVCRALGLGTGGGDE